MDAETGLETKVISGEGADEMLLAFEAFKEANDERLAQIERRMDADVVTTEKVERIDRALDELALKFKRPQLGASEKPNGSEHKAAFEAYVRKGESAQLSDIESKAMSVGSNPDGGYLVPPETEAHIESVLKLSSPIRAMAGVRQVSSSLYKKPFAIAGASSGWVGETAARPETAAPTLAELQFPTMELYAMPAATQSLLDDAAVNLEEWLADEVQQVFAFPASNPADRVMDLVYALKSGYRQNALWTMNRKTQSVIRKFKDGQGNYLWQPALSAAGSATLLGFPVTEVEHMPDIGTDSFSLGFGDFNRGYLIVDRVGVRIFRDPYSSKPYVLFYTTKRVGGGVQNFEAIKLMKFGVS